MAEASTAGGGPGCAICSDGPQLWWWRWWQRRGRRTADATGCGLNDLKLHTSVVRVPHAFGERMFEFKIKLNVFQPENLNFLAKLLALAGCAVPFLTGMFVWLLFSWREGENRLNPVVLVSTAVFGSHSHNTSCKLIGYQYQSNMRFLKSW